jgi:hypothetical protein
VSIDVNDEPVTCAAPQDFSNFEQPTVPAEMRYVFARGTVVLNLSAHTMIVHSGICFPHNMEATLRMSRMPVVCQSSMLSRHSSLTILQTTPWTRTTFLLCERHKHRPLPAPLHMHSKPHPLTLLCTKVAGLNPHHNGDTQTCPDPATSPPTTRHTVGLAVRTMRLSAPTTLCHQLKPSRQSVA